MSDLLLPPKVAKEIQKDKWVQQRREFRGVISKLFDFDGPVCKEWNPQLRELDPLLRLGKAHPMAYEPGWPVVPGFYHWVRDNESAPPTVTPITGPDESFREPDSGVLEDLRRSDLQNPKVFGMLLEARVAGEREREQRKGTMREERQQEMIDRWAAASRVQVSMNPDSEWTQNHKGRKRRGKK